MHGAGGIRVVVIGGGTGSFALLNGLKNYTFGITALVNMVDDGGSTGVLRDELGALPPGDIRQCLVALSRSSQTMRDLFNYRFPQGSFAAGHSFGNLFLSALEKTTGSFAEAVSQASEVLNVAGRVVPITLDDIRLVMEDETGKVTRNEHAIGDEEFEGRKMSFRLEPRASINEAARLAIREADVVVLAPGDLYTSLAPALLVDGVGRALVEARAKVVYVCNLVTTHGQTDGYQVQDFADEIERFIGAPRLDYVLYNSRPPSQELLGRYAKAGEYGVIGDKQAMRERRYKPLAADLISDTIQQGDPNDTLFQRTYIRHDGEKVAKLLMKLYFK